MSSPRQEDYVMDTGLIDDFDAVISDVAFEINSDYAAKSGSSDPLLTLYLDSDILEEPFSQGYSCGGAKKWEIKNGGKSIVSGINPDSHVFNKNARTGILVTRMYELIGEGSIEAGQKFFRERGHYMTDVAFYAGLNFHWKRELHSTVEGKSGSEVLLPNKYLGTNDTGKAAAAGVVGDLDKVVAELAVGKDDRGLKIAATKSDALKANPTYMRDLISGNKIAELEIDGKLKRGDGGKFV